MPAADTDLIDDACFPINDAEDDPEAEYWRVFFEYQRECQAVIVKNNGTACFGDITVIACMDKLGPPSDQNALTCEEITARDECLGHRHGNECPTALEVFKCVDLLNENFTIPEGCDLLCKSNIC